MGAPNPTPDVSARYGAPMGRSSYSPNDCEGTPEQMGRFYLQRVPLNGGGYDRGGAYWGLGAPLWWYGSANGEVDAFIRARSRDAAKAKVRDGYPGAVFFR